MAESTPTPKKSKRTKPTAPRVCRLTLTVLGVEYRVRPVQVEGAPRAFTLTRDGAEPYTVAAGPWGVRCSCEAYQFRKANAACKHADAARAVGLL